MAWLQVQDGSLLNLDHVLGFYIQRLQAAAPNDPATHRLVAFSPLGSAAPPWIVATGSEERMTELVNQLRPDLGQILTLPELREPKPDTGAGGIPGQYL